MNLFEVFIKIGADTSESDKAIKDTGAKTKELGEKVKSGLKTVAKVSAAAMGTMAAGVAKVVKDATAAYADYEQLVGGVETLFKQSSDTVLQYADNAYKTAGLSANQYMETVTSFSASLLQSLGGDTAKAAKYADMAITGARLLTSFPTPAKDCSTLGRILPAAVATESTKLSTSLPKS